MFLDCAFLLSHRYLIVIYMLITSVRCVSRPLARADRPTQDGNKESTFDLRLPFLSNDQHLIRCRHCRAPHWTIRSHLVRNSYATMSASVSSQSTSRFSALLSPSTTSPSLRSISSSSSVNNVPSSYAVSSPPLPHASTSMRTSVIYERNVIKSRGSEVNLGAWAFLFSEIIQYTQRRVSGIGEFEKRSVLHSSVSASSLSRPSLTPPLRVRLTTFAD